MSQLQINIQDGDQSHEGWAELTEAEAMALAQFCKRVTFSEMRDCAVDNDEAYLIRDAIDKLQTGLRLAGYAPR